MKDFIFASTPYLILLNSLRNKTGKEFIEISNAMEAFYDQSEAIINKQNEDATRLKISALVTTLERDHLSRELGQLMNEVFKKDKELFSLILEKFTVLPKKNEPQR